MWAQVVLCVLVGLAAADPEFYDSAGYQGYHSADRNHEESSNPGWKNNREYVYKVHGRTLASLREVEKQYSGVMYNAEIRIQPKPDGKLQARIVNIQHSPVHTQIAQRWNSHISDKQLQWQPLQISEDPFQINMKSGVITDLIVNKNIPNWEANFIKSIVSQFQLNTNGHQQIQNGMSSWSREQNSAVFKVMEATITGDTETLYTIKPVPSHVVQKSPWFSIEHRQEGEENVLEVYKYKNYTNYQELPSYFYGFGKMEDGEPATNWMSDSFSRIASTHAILTGNLNSYTIQHSISVNDIVIKPTLQDQQKGSVVSSVNVTLHSVNSQFKTIGEVPDPISLKTLVYSYEQPFANSNEVRERRDLNSWKLDGTMRREMNDRMNRLRRSINDDIQFLESEESYSDIEELYRQERPKLDQAPHSPLLPYTMGYQGQSLKQMLNISKNVQDLARLIAEALQFPEEIFQQDILSSWITMTSLIRIMHTDELQELSQKLYSESNERQERDVWFVFRDAVAESGTAPALQVIQTWMNEKKLEKMEASQIFSTLMSSAHQPTVEYMSLLWNLVKSSTVQSQWPLNSTALLKYSELVHQAYVDKYRSSKQFPIKSFGKFRNDESKQFIRGVVIPYMTKELQNSISNAETEKIHVYIRALGNIGHPRVLSAFEPYLEGKKQASQFQRFLMVLSMNYLAKTYPEEARSVLFKIYQNSGESQEVRVIAVYQLMRTNPPPEMLQMMATFTNIDKHDQVSAAVKSSIETAANLKNSKHERLRQAAVSAKPLLTKKVFGIQHVGNYIREYLTEQVDTQFDEHLEIISSQDAFFPKGFQYFFSSQIGGIRRKMLEVKGIATSLKKLMYAFEELTEEKKKQKEEQSEHYEEQKQHPWSSATISRLLHLKSEELEQLEGMFSVGSESFDVFFSFDNNTLKMLPSVVRRFEDQLKNGLSVDYTKFLSQNEIAYAIPTETGLPFLYTYDQPKILKVEGKMHLQSSPHANQRTFGRLGSLKLKTQMGFTVSSKIQGRLSFTTPYDHQRYIAGYDKEWQTHVPLFGEYDINMEQQTVKAEIEIKEPHEDAHLFQYRSRPYTSKTSLSNFQPISTQQGTKFLKQKNQRSYDKVVGQKQVGLALQFKHTYERESINLPILLQQIQENGPLSGLLKLFNYQYIQFRKFQIKYLPQQSSTKKMLMEFSWKGGYKDQSESDNNDNFARESQSAENQSENQHVTEQKLAAGIKNVHVKLVEASVEFQGEENFKHILIGGLATSNVDLTSRIAIHYKRTSNSQDAKPYEMSFKTQTKAPNTHSIDVKSSLDKEPVVDSVMYLSFGPINQRKSRIEAQIDLRRSQERIQYLKEQPEYKQCQKEIMYGNKQLSSCVNITMMSGLLDRVNVRIQHEKLPTGLKEALRAAYYHLRYSYYPQVHKASTSGLQISESDVWNVNARFEPDLRFVNVSIQAHQEELHIIDIPVSDYYRENFIGHAVYSLPTRMKRYALGLQPYRPFCVVDQTVVNSFNNYTYPAEISQYWTVMLHYLPKQARYQNQQQSVEEQLRYQPENYLVLVRKSSELHQKKEIKITLSSPETNYQVVEITLKPSGNSNPKARVWINDKQISINSKESPQLGSDIRPGYIQVFALANGEVKFGIKNAFYLIYDGARVRLSALNDKFKDDIRGLCGQFNNEDTLDFMTSENCVARSYKEFVKSWEVEGFEGQQLREEFSGRTQKCAEKQVPVYVDVISARDSRRQPSEFLQTGGSSGQCTDFQTRYVRDNGELCFTIRPLPVCRSGCQANRSIDKKVPVHCVQNSNAAQLWKTQIDKGASPDFSQKQESKSVYITVPQRCSE